MSVVIIAEIGSVHDGSFGNALRLIDAAVDCGASGVKFQLHIAQAETLRDAPTPPYFTDEPRHEYFTRTVFTKKQWQKLKQRCDANGVTFACSPFSEEAVDVLEEVGVSCYKIASGEVTNLPLLGKLAKLGKPLILSSGMSSWAELDRAVETIRKQHDRLTVLQCTSEYPCAYERVGLDVMLQMRQRYGLPVGLSDHTLTTYAAFAAVTLGASVIEKHFTFSRRMYGSDARFSLEPSEFADLVKGIRAIEEMLANPVDKDDVGRFKVMKETFEKSLVTLVDIPAGVSITRKMLGIKKPGTGISAARLHEVIGRRTSRAIPSGQLLMGSDIVWEEET